MLALGQVDSSIGHFSSYLRHWSPRSYKNLVLRLPSMLVTQRQHSVFRRDIFDLIPDIAVDLAYFDPPYGSNNAKMPPSRVRYASYYHLWTTVCLHDQPTVFGKAQRRCDSSDKIAASVFEEFRRSDQDRFIAVEAIDKLLKMTSTQWIILSYSSGGRATASELNAVIHQHGRVLDTLELAYKKNVMAGMKWTHEWLGDVDHPNREYLFLIEKK